MGKMVGLKADDGGRMEARCAGGEGERRRERDGERDRRKEKIDVLLNFPVKMHACRAT